MAAAGGGGSSGGSSAGSSGGSSAGSSAGSRGTVKPEGGGGGSSSSSSGSEAEESARMARIWAAIGGTACVPGRTFGYAGLAAWGVEPRSIVLVVAKSTNDNAVVYHYAYDAAHGVRIHATWLSLEPCDVDAHLAANNGSLLSALSVLEEQYYGTLLESALNADGSARYTVALATPQLRSRPFDLLMDASGVPFLRGTLSGRAARVTHAYLHLRRDMSTTAMLAALSGRAIEEVRVYGVATDGADSGMLLTERLRPS